MSNITIRSLEKATAEIKQQHANIATSFITVGSILKEIKDNETYVESGYNNVYEYAEAEFNYKITNTKNLINVATNYSNGTNILPQYSNFNLSQLTEMLSIEEQEVKEKITADMTVKQIREVKRTAKPSRTSDRKKVKEEKSSDPVTEEFNNQKHEAATIPIIYVEVNDSEIVKLAIDKLKTNITNPISMEKRISDYLIERVKSDELFARSVAKGNGDMKKCVDYLYKHAKEKAAGERNIAIDDATIYGWAVHYFDEDKEDKKNVSVI